MSRHTGFLCLETSVSDVLSQNTFGGTTAPRAVSSSRLRRRCSIPSRFAELMSRQLPAHAAAPLSAEKSLALAAAACASVA
jgi:hypothetical protein